MALDHLLRPIVINKLELKNRIARAAHGTSYGNGGINDAFIAYHVERAKAGVALNILETTSVHPTSYSHTIAAWDDGVITGFKALADACGRHGMRTFAQLWHGGHRWTGKEGRAPWAPSTVPCPLGTVNTPLAMTLDQVEELIEAFGAGAARARAGGLDGVELHFGHGYLVHQFLCPLTNKREDAYGGDFEGRIRFARDVLQSVRAKAGADFPIGIRISDYNVPGGLSAEEAGDVVARLCKEKLLDYVSASMGSPYSIATMLGAMDVPAGYMLSSSGKIAERATVPTMIAGRYRTLEEADQAIREGSADMVSLVRAMIADPELVSKSIAGRAERVRPCIGCNQGCIGGIRTSLQRMLCTVNPAVGFETTLSESLIRAADKPQKVVIVGGGPAGMEAARLAALCGHKTILFEAQTALGGAINIAKRAPKLQSIGDITHWLEQEIYLLGVDVRLSTYVEADDVRAESPDVVIVATGSLPRMDGYQVARPEAPIRGFDLPHVISSHDALQRPRESFGASAVVLDDVGHYEAIAAAEQLIVNGVKVTFVTRHSSFAPHIEVLVRTSPALRRLREGDFTLHVGSRLVSIGKHSVEIGYLDGEQIWSTPADTVVLVTYNAAQNDLYYALGGGKRGPLPYALHLIGDAQAPRDLLVAIREGHFAGRIGQTAAA